MNMNNNIRDAVQQKTRIELKENDFKGKGQFGEVYLHDIQNHSIAVKCFKDQDAVYAVQEAKTFQQIESIVKDCPGILSYYGMKKLNIEIKKNIQILNENYQGNCLFMQACYKNLKEINKFPQNEFFNFLSQISLSLFCLHQNGCSHNDLKPANILFNINDKSQFLYYLTDFGESKFLKKINIDTFCQNQSLKGTPFYFSPELLALYRKNIHQGEYNSLSADIFALGLICLELLIGSQFVLKLNSYYNQPDKYNKEVDNIKAELLKLPEFQSNSQKKILNLLVKMISFDRKLRPQAIEICQKLVEAQLFKMDTLETNNMQALLYQLISTLNMNDMKALISQLIYPQKPQQDLNVQQLQEESKAIAIPQETIKTIKIPTFQSNILQDSTYSSLILSLFEDSNVTLSKIHSQNIKNSFDYKKFHAECDNQGSTLLIFSSKEEPNSFFGGMAVPNWESPKKDSWAKDPADKSSWLFKIELEGKQAKLHQWKCINKKYAINCDKDYGPYFGGGLGLLGGAAALGGAASHLSSKNGYYDKLDLNSQLKNQNHLLYQLQKKINIDCPTKVIGKIMSEQEVSFKLSKCEVFAIKK